MATLFIWNTPNANEYSCKQQAKPRSKQCDTNLLFVLKHRKEITAWLSPGS